LFHSTRIREFTGKVKNEFCEDLRQFLPVLESRGLLGACGEVGRGGTLFFYDAGSNDKFNFHREM
jgi:hypothetical protein